MAKKQEKEATIAEKCFQRVVLLTADDKFFKDIVAIKRKYGIPEGGITPDNRIPEGQFNDCLKEIEQLRVKYNLSQLHSAPLVWLILFAKWPRENLEDYIDYINFKIEKDKYGQDVLYLAVYPEMGIKDIQNNWKRITKKVKDVYGYEHTKQRIRKNLFRDYYINYFRKIGFPHKKIASIIENVYGVGYGYERPPITINQLKVDAQKELRMLIKKKKRLTAYDD